MSDHDHNHQTFTMKGDDTPPANRAILATALITLVTLVGLKYLLDAYYDTMFEGERTVATERSEGPYRELAAAIAAGDPVAQELAPRVTTYRDLAEVMADGQAAAPGIDRAVGMMKLSVRTPTERHPAIRPELSDDITPLRGWTQLPPNLVSSSRQSARAGAPAAVPMEVTPSMANPGVVVNPMAVPTGVHQTPTQPSQLEPPMPRAIGAGTPIQ